MMALITALIPVILTVIGFILDRAKVSIETKKAFLKMVEGMGKDGVVSVRLHESYREQRKRLEAPELL